MMTGHSGIFAGGDMVPSERTVTVAVGHGKLAARHIDAWLRGAVYHKPPKHPPVTFDMLDLPVFLEAARRREPELPLAVRGSFDEVRSEEHTSELQSLMRISYAVFCLKQKKT